MSDRISYEYNGELILFKEGVAIAYLSMANLVETEEMLDVSNVMSNGDCYVGGAKSFEVISEKVHSSNNENALNMIPLLGSFVTFEMGESIPSKKAGEPFEIDKSKKWHSGNMFMVRIHGNTLYFKGTGGLHIFTEDQE